MKSCFNRVTPPLRSEAKLGQQLLFLCEGQGFHTHWILNKALNFCAYENSNSSWTLIVETERFIYVSQEVLVFFALQRSCLRLELRILNRICQINGCALQFKSLEV